MTFRDPRVLGAAKEEQIERVLFDMGYRRTESDCLEFKRHRKTSRGEYYHTKVYLKPDKISVSTHIDSNYNGVGIHKTKIEPDDVRRELYRIRGRLCKMCGIHPSDPIERVVKVLNEGSQ